MTSAPMEQIGFYFPGEDSTTIEISKLQAGDVIGFVMSHREAWTHLKDAKVQKVPYEIFRFGHVAVVTSEHTLLSVCMGQPVTDDIPVSSLADQSWFAFRPPSGSVDRDRLDEFVSLVTEKAASKQAYDFTGAFGLWNVDSSPEAPNEIAAEYTCATLVVAALHYSGYHMDAVHRGGILDIVTPRQVIDSHGWTGRSL